MKIQDKRSAKDQCREVKRALENAGVYSLVYGGSDEGYFFDVDAGDNLKLDIPKVEKIADAFSCYLDNVATWPGVVCTTVMRLSLKFKD